MYKIQKASVIGAGTMGLGIAGQLANAGIEVLLLDLPSENGNRNAVCERAIERLLDEQQPGLLHKNILDKIKIGNIEDDMHLIAESDWIAEAIVERLELKRDLYRKIDQIRRIGSIVSSNTSTIPISLLVDGMPDQFKKEFAITHYFNPVRYMQLLEVVKGEMTSPEVIDCLAKFNQENMGKGIVLCNDTPGFLGNRVGVFAIQTALHKAFHYDLRPEEADAIFGRPMGIPKTGVFGLYDLIGIDLMSDVAKSLINILPKEDVFHEVSDEIPLMKKMMEKGLMGNKGLKGGFYRFEDPDDSSSKQTLDFQDFTYRAFSYERPELSVVAEQQNDFTLLLEGDSKYSKYAWDILSNTFCYAASLVPDVNTSLVAIDDAMKLGYNWAQGPFEMIDKVGVDNFISRLKKEGREIPWIIQEAAGKSFYRVNEGHLEYFTAEGTFKKVQRDQGLRRFAEERKMHQPILTNKAASYYEINNAIGMVEFHSKANALDTNSMELLGQAVAHAEKNFTGLIIHNDASHFSCGVNLEAIGRFIESQDWNGLDEFLKHFQQTVKTMKYSNIPVISAPSGLSIGGGFEVILGTDMTVYHANSVTGLVESLVGVVPGGGGVKELLYRWRDIKGNEVDAAWATFMNVGYGKTAQSPLEAKELAMYREGIDRFVMNRDRLLDTAVGEIRKLAKNYQPIIRGNFIMPGRDVWQDMQNWLHKTHEKGHLTPHDVTTGTQIARIVTGGDVDAGTVMNEDDLFDMERKAFLTLAKTEQTRKRIQHMLNYGKPLRN
ncbi:MAG: 3-hydroxyacyl-CoA dehydrogenase NAD-binding domain-containing protein [Woeseiaceae bacterium]|nr:3-hydroxyacyl-CoA dehydrogenase NAD-binding domain-containing protein [Woeseiaceae bacterium]